MIKKCQFCGEEFETPEWRHAKFCSNACSTNSRRGISTEIRECPECGKKFRIAIYKKTRFCSVACGSRHSAKLGKNVGNFILLISIIAPTVSIKIRVAATKGKVFVNAGDHSFTTESFIFARETAALEGNAIAAKKGIKLSK